MFIIRYVEQFSFSRANLVMIFRLVLINIILLCGLAQFHDSAARLGRDPIVVSEVAHDCVWFVAVGLELFGGVVDLFRNSVVVVVAAATVAAVAGEEIAVAVVVPDQFGWYQLGSVRRSKSLHLVGFDLSLSFHSKEPEPFLFSSVSCAYFGTWRFYFSKEDKRFFKSLLLDILFYIKKQ